MKKNILFLLSCLSLSSCYINKFSDFSQTFPPPLDTSKWTPITSSPIFIDDTVPYIVHTGTDKIVYIYKNSKNQLIYLEHNSLLNTTKQHNISSVLTPGATIVKLVYTEFGSQKIIGIVDRLNKFKSYIIHNNFNTSPQYDFLIPSSSINLYLHFHSASKGNLLYENSGGTDLESFDLTPSANPPIHTPSLNVAPTGFSYTTLTRNKNSLALYYNTDKFKTYNFTDGSVADGPSFTAAGLNMFMFSLQEGNDIWVTTTTAGKMNIYKVRVQNDGSIPSTTLIRSDLDTLEHGFIAKGEGGDYFMASQNVVDNKVQIVKTSDNFNTMEILGGITATTSEFKSVGGVPYLSYINTTTKELTILKYSNNEPDNDVSPQANISINSTTVSHNTPFTVSASTSSGNNLRYFWSVSPNNGATVENSTHSTTRITLPPSSAPIEIILEINDGSRSDRTTQEVTVL